MPRAEPLGKITPRHPGAITEKRSPQPPGDGHATDETALLAAAQPLDPSPRHLAEPADRVTHPDSRAHQRRLGRNALYPTPRFANYSERCTVLNGRHWRAGPAMRAGSRTLCSGSRKVMPGHAAMLPPLDVRRRCCEERLWNKTALSFSCGDTTSGRAITASL